MQVLSIAELMHLTGTDLCGLLAEAKHILRRHAATAPEQARARANIAAIRMVLMRWRSGPAPCGSGQPGKSGQICQESRNNRGPQQGSTHLRSSGQILFLLHKLPEFVHKWECK
ncbi:MULTISPECIES: hypothetical protein [unclassified Bradyrhizobium]|uniref:hypothetical protein n=1 Tax=Bradyrhizobium sp. USDA 4541 TaxID=2817704 RepID=UPI0020A5E2CA|nr:hypothetical protein [Bradyrhizobium sp. USDA 4541]MCP1854549.1 hypothetical protein [Bradyrhizobium sp. USDA 4541]